MFVLFGMSCTVANAQFTLTPDGLVPTDNPDMDYIVVPFEGQSAEELYNKAKVYLLSIYVDPKNVLSSVENSAITINGISENSIKIFKAKRYSGLGINYTISIAFKDGKMRVNIPSIQKIFFDNGAEFYITGNSFLLGGFIVFSNNGKIQNEVAKESIEDFFNNDINNLVSAMNVNHTDDW